MRYSTQDIIDGWISFALERVEKGWSPYLVTFMFNQLHGSLQSVARQMDHEVERTYAKHATRIIRNMNRPSSVGRRPVWICSVDYPVKKHVKTSLRDAIVNGGRHMHSATFLPPASRMPEDLATHFDEQRGLYMPRGCALARIDVEPITHDLENVVDYVLKGLRSARSIDDNVLILPRVSSEM